MPLAASIRVHRVATLTAVASSLTATALSLLRVERLGSGELLATVTTALVGVSVAALLHVVALAPRGSGVHGWFGLVVATTGLAALLLKTFALGTAVLLLVAGSVLVGVVAMAQVWTCLARALGSGSLSEDLRNAYVVTFTGAALSRLAPSLGTGTVLMVLAAMAAVPGAIMYFRSLGELEDVSSI